MFLFILLFFLSPASWGTTLVETATAVGIANTLQGTQQGTATGHLERANTAVQEYQSAVDRTEGQLLRSRAQEAEAIEQIQLREQALREDYERGHSENQRYDQYDYHSAPPPELLHENLAAEIARRRQNEEFREDEEFNPNGDQDISSNKITVNYKAKTVVFYKKDCAETETNCQKSHPVLTNIKSVIFNHAQGRLLSSTKEK